MMFHAPTGRMVLPAKAIEDGARHLRWALKSIRESVGLPLDRYERHGPLEKADFAQMAIIEAAEVMGIDLGVTRLKFNEMDLRDAG